MKSDAHLYASIVIVALPTTRKYNQQVRVRDIRGIHPENYLYK